MNAIDIMMEEHKYISRMLEVIKKACFKIYKNKSIDYGDFRNIILFIREYADAHHHKKEEIILFNRMIKHIGKVAEKTINYGMLVEHDMGRMYISSLEEALKRSEKGDEKAILDIIANAISYTHLLERHIDKENNVIYKFGEKHLSEEVFKTINEDSIRFEKDNLEISEKNIKLLELLEKRYL